MILHPERRAINGIESQQLFVNIGVPLAKFVASTIRKAEGKIPTVNTLLQAKSASSATLMEVNVNERDIIERVSV